MFFSKMLNWTQTNTPRERAQEEEHEDTKMKQNHADRGNNTFEDAPIEATSLKERECGAQAEKSGMALSIEGATGRAPNYSEESKVMANRQSFGETIESIQKVWAKDRWRRIETGEVIGGEILGRNADMQHRKIRDSGHHRRRQILDRQL